MAVTAFALGFGIMPVYRRVSVVVARNVAERRPEIREARPYQPEHYANRVAVFRALRDTSSTVTMLGDSRIEFCDWAELLAQPADIANRGISGDTIGGLLARLDDSVPAGSRVCVVEVGINDLIQHVAVDAAEAQFRRLLTALSNRQQRIVLTSVIDVDAGQPGLNRRIAALNGRLAQLARQTPNTTWLDLNPRLSPGGALAVENIFEGAHLTDHGYAVWGNLLAPVLAGQEKTSVAVQ